MLVTVSELLVTVSERSKLAPGGCFTNVSRALSRGSEPLQNILPKFVYCRNRADENFKLKLSMYAQSMALSIRLKFQLEILSINVISAIVYFREIIRGSMQNGSEPGNYPHGAP